MRFILKTRKAGSSIYSNMCILGHTASDLQEAMNVQVSRMWQKACDILVLFDLILISRAGLCLTFYKTVTLLSDMNGSLVPCAKCSQCTRTRGVLLTLLQSLQHTETLNSVHIIHLCLPCDSHSKQRLLPTQHSQLRRNVFHVRYELNICILPARNSIFKQHNTRYAVASTVS